MFYIHSYLVAIYVEKVIKLAEGVAGGRHNPSSLDNFAKFYQIIYSMFWKRILVVVDCRLFANVKGGHQLTLGI